MGADLPAAPERVLRGRYRLGAQLGRGGMGAVYAAEDLHLGRQVAIKLIVEESDQFAIERFRREARAAGGLAHPHIAQVLDYALATEGEPALIVMELLQGESLASALRREGAFPVSRALDIAAQIADALGAAHRAGIVHRDIKPENVFLVTSSSKTDFVKVLDFGIAKRTGEVSLTTSHQIVGTIAYMSPEQATASAITPASDVFSLGVVLYQMLADALPHRGDTVQSILVGLEMNTLVPIEERAAARGVVIPAAVVDLLARCLVRDPERRLRDGTMLLSAIDAVRAGDPQPEPEVVLGEAPTVRSSPRALAPPPSRPHLGLVMAVVAVGAVGAGVGLAKCRGPRVQDHLVARVTTDAMSSGDAMPSGDAVPMLDALVEPGPDAPGVIADAQPRESPRPSPTPKVPRVKGITVMIHRWQFDEEVQDFKKPALAAVLRDLDFARCYRGEAIAGAYQNDELAFHIDAEGSVSAFKGKRWWQFQPPVELPARLFTCLVAVVRGLDVGRWNNAGVGGTFEITIESSNKDGRPLER